MFTITVNTNKGTFSGEFSEKILLSDAFSALGISASHPCGGRGTCKKCTAFIDNAPVLSCQTYIDSDTCVDYTISEGDIQGITFGNSEDFEKSPLLDEGFGAAIDIGTTTVACHIYKFPEDECVKSIALANPQGAHGADVVSRITYAIDGGLDTLSGEVREVIEKLTCGYQIEKCVITGNTTMLHLLTGTSPEALSHAPFLTETLFGEWRENAYLPGCISAFLGADITTAILASGMLQKQTAILADIGTNGELALINGGELIGCSTAAGPALEGAGISCGVQAIPGAINKCFVKDGRLSFETIDGAAPIGVTGSGIIDLTACLLELGVIDESGYMEDDFEISEGIFLTPADVRNIQLAKASIRAGIDTLLKDFSLSADGLDAFYIAGGFGSFINPENAAKIGLIPKELVEKAVISGNCALSGAAMILRSCKALEKSNEIAKSTRTLDLSANPYFMEKYIDNMEFSL